MTTSNENPTQFALLGLLNGAPMSGYEIKKSFDEGVNHFWNVSYGQIYPELKRLVDRGYAGVREEPGRGAPARKVYRITARGREALREWLAKPPVVRPARSEVALKLCFGAFGRMEDQISHLEAFGAAQERQLETLRRIERTARAEDMEREQLFSLLTLRMGIALSGAMSQWARESVRTLQKAARASGDGKTGKGRTKGPARASRDVGGGKSRRRDGRRT